MLRLNHCQTTVSCRKDPHGTSLEVQSHVARRNGPGPDGVIKKGTGRAKGMSMDSAENNGVMSRVGLQLRQFVCSMHGHDSLLHFGEGRVSLLCSSCGHETPGWDVKGNLARREAVRPERRVVQMPLVSERRV